MGFAVRVRPNALEISEESDILDVLEQIIRPELSLDSCALWHHLPKPIRQTLGGERVDPTSPKIVDKLGFDGTRWANDDTKRANEKI